MRNFKIGSGESAMRFNGDDDSANVTWNGEESYRITQKGIGLANVATADLNADVPEGTLVYDSTANVPKWFDGAAYQQFGGGLSVYTEAAWTPNLWDTSESSSEGQTYSTQTGYSVRIGKMVYIEGQLVVTSLGTLSTGQFVKIGPLPYTARAGSAAVLNCFSLAGITIAGAVNYVFSPAGSNTFAYILYEWDDNSQNFMTVGDVSADGNIQFSGWYVAA